MTSKEISEQFLKTFGKNIVYTWGRFFYFDCGRYWEIAEYDLITMIAGYCQSKNLEAKVNERSLKEILENLKPRCQWIHRGITPPCWIGDVGFASDVIPVRNGLLNLDSALVHSESALIEHDHRLFTFVTLPYNFDPNAECPTWLKFLGETFPDEDRIKFLQEWFGYHFLPHRYFQRMVLLWGQGANGKTVVCAVLKELLGSKNVSSVGLDQFDPKRTFPLAATVGKLGNIVGELNPASKAAEGLLKQYVSGETITIEEKYKPAFDVRPTAHLTFATNELPKFVDRSDGIWRRLIIVPFENQILDESKQDKRLVTPEFWKSELPGIFMWALQGRRRLLERGHFIEPSASIAAKSAYRSDMNTALSFLRTYFHAIPSGRVSSNAMYLAYGIYAGEMGERPLTASQFAEEVRREFPSAELSKNPVSLGDGRRGRVWSGIGSASGTTGTGGTR